MISQGRIEKDTLYAVLPQQVILGQLDSGFIAEPNDRLRIQELWERAHQAYNQLGSGSRSFLSEDDIAPLKEIEKKKLDATLARVRKYPPYDSHPTQILDVKISKLVTPQISVNPLRAAKRATIKPGMSKSAIFDINFEGGAVTPSITRQVLGMAPNGGALLFTSYDEDIRLHHPPQYRRIPINERDETSPTLDSVCLPVGGGLPFAAGYRIEIAPGVSRLIINNGIHRAYELAKSEYETCPIAVCDLLPLELPEPFVELPREVLLNPASNPPLITDFLNERIVIPLTYHSLLRTIRLNWNFEQYVTVLK